MAGKNYKLTLNKSDGTSQTVTFTIPQGEKGAAGDKGATGPDGDKGPVGYKGYCGNGIYAISVNSSDITTVTADDLTAAGYDAYCTAGDIILNKDGKIYICDTDMEDNSAEVTYVQSLMGAVGDKGAAGDKGDTGPDGDKGETGPDGDKGPKCIIVTSATVTAEA